MKIPCDDCMFRKEDKIGKRRIICCSDDEKMKDFKPSPSFYVYDCKHYRKEEYECK